MAKDNVLSAALEGVAIGLGQLAQDAAADIGNTYQDVFMGWPAGDHTSDMTQDRAVEISRDTVEQEYSGSQEIEREI